MWYRTENGSDVKPAALDTTSSKRYVYVRKDFVEVPATQGDQPIPAHWSWLEAKILKEDWAIYEEVLNHGEALDDVYDALTELAEMILEG